MNTNRDYETQIHEIKNPAKGHLHDIGVRFNREQANDLADGWTKAGAALFGEPVKTRVYHRFVKVDGISYPLFFVVARGPKPEPVEDLAQGNPPDYYGDQAYINGGGK